MVVKSLMVFCSAIISLSLALPASFANDSYKIETPRFILYVGNGARPVGTKSLTSTQITDRVLATLASTHEELVRIFGYTPDRKVVLRFLTPDEFQERTGAPSWTSAMYFKNEISIPIDPQEVDLEDLRIAARHEYVHAFLGSMTKSRIPAWLDEGLAQIIEGEPNPVLGPALRTWISHRDAIPLDWLRDGFTTLDAAYVPAAYAESMFITRTLINQHGIKAIRNYLNSMRKGESHQKAFQAAFQIPQDEFEEEITIQIARWAKSGAKNP